MKQSWMLMQEVSHWGLKEKLSLPQLFNPHHMCRHRELLFFHYDIALEECNHHLSRAIFLKADETSSGLIHQFLFTLESVLSFGNHFINISQ